MAANIQAKMRTYAQQHAWDRAAIALIPSARSIDHAYIAARARLIESPARQQPAAAVASVSQAR
jgi:hypothetical protein